MRRLTGYGCALAALAAFTAGAKASECEYFFTFEDRSEELFGWSDTNLTQTPVGARNYLGQFGNETVTFNVNLPAATSLVVIAFDLFVIGDWNGESGPSLFDLTIDGSNTLAHTTFSNSQDAQHYPNAFPGSTHPARSGAAENNSLGYHGDSVYNFFFILPRGGGPFSMAFDVSGLSQDIEVASWGLDNVGVCALIPEPASVSLLALGGLLAGARRNR